MSRFVATITPNQSSVVVSMSGTLDEDADLTKINIKPFTEVQIDLNGIDCVTSRGIRSWLIWLEELDRTKQYFIKRCSRIFANQANLIREMLPGWIEVNAVEVIYYCDNCSSNLSVDVSVRDGKPSAILPETIKCDSCGDAAELDILPDRYFQFLNR